MSVRHLAHSLPPPSKVELEGELNRHGITEAMRSGSLPGASLGPLGGDAERNQEAPPWPQDTSTAKRPGPQVTRTASGMPFQKPEVLEGFARRWECFWW